MLLWLRESIISFISRMKRCNKQNIMLMIQIEETLKLLQSFFGQKLVQQGRKLSMDSQNSVDLLSLLRRILINSYIKAEGPSSIVGHYN